jgi:hypothetical protein
MKIIWNDWDLVVSASQIESWDSCRRKWWFQKVQRLPELDKGFQIYGNVIHSVADRFFGADDLGYDRATGKPVDLYPAGWEKSYDRTDKTRLLGTVSPQEQAQIKLLVRKAIETGIWVRHAGREPEASFFRKLSDRLAIIGYIDLMLPREVQDHKSTKNMRYAKSAKDLESNTQLFIYAKECLLRAEERGEKLDSVVVRHNTFSKDPSNPIVQSVRAELPAERIEEFWQLVIETAKDMRTLKRAGIAPEMWSAVPGPESKDTCQDYGGCPFLTICGKVETPNKYRARMELAVKAQQVGSAALTPGKNDMGIFSKMKTTATPAAPAATKPSQPAPPSMPRKEDRPQPTTPAPEAPATALHPNQEKAPWAREGCKGCNSMGISKAGKPCRVCDTMNKKDGKPTSANWTLGTDNEGRITWTDGATSGSTPAVLPVTAKDKTTAEHAPTAKPAAIPAIPAASPAAPTGVLGKRKPGRPRKTETEGAAAPAAAQAPEVAQEATPEPVGLPVEDVQTAVGPEAIEEAVKSKGGRPPVGFTLLIGCLPERGKTTGVIGLDQEFERFGTELAQTMGAESYFALDAYKRRDWMAMRAKEIAATFGTKLVTAVGTSPDFLEFLTAIKPYANHVYVGVSR